jgi:putative Mg2+ transporter-C (MgtC) family protein
MLINFYKEIEMLGPIAIKILVATICGALVGWEREIKNKFAGLRTNLLICVGSCIFTICSFYAANLYNIADPTRILSTIVTGMGFLGGGVIMKDHDKIIGITTAAFIWVISGIGILCGMGLIIIPIILTIGLLLVSRFFEKVERYIRKDSDDRN